MKLRDSILLQASVKCSIIFTFPERTELGKTILLFVERREDGLRAVYEPYQTAAGVLCKEEFTIHPFLYCYLKHQLRQAGIKHIDGIVSRDKMQKGYCLT